MGALYGPETCDIINQMKIDFKPNMTLHSRTDLYEPYVGEGVPGYFPLQWWGVTSWGRDRDSKVESWLLMSDSLPCILEPIIKNHP